MKKILFLVCSFLLFNAAVFAEYITYNPETGQTEYHSSLSDAPEPHESPNINTAELEDAIEEVDDIEEILDDLIYDEPEVEETPWEELWGDEYIEDTMDSDEITETDSETDGSETDSPEEIDDMEPPETEGDPVFITTGQYSLKETDERFKWGRNIFSIKRNYLSFVYPEGSFGKSWNCSLDTRLVFGIPPKSKKNKLDNLKKRIKTVREKLNKYSSYCQDKIKKLDELENKCSEVKLDFVISGVTNSEVLYGYADTYYNGLAYNQLVHISADGGAQVFTYDSKSKRFIPQDKRICKTVWITYNSSERYFHVYYLNGKEITYDYIGKPIYEKDRYGLKIEYKYDSDNYINAIKHNGKNIISITRNEDKLIKKIKNNITGNETSYLYKGKLLAKVIDWQGDSYSYEYDDDDDLKTLIKPDRSSSSIEYKTEKTGLFNLNSEKKVAAFKNEEGKKEKFTSTLLGKNFSYQDADGMTTSYGISGNKIILKGTSDGQIIQWKYNSNKQIKEKIDFFGTTEYEYDDYGNVCKTKGTYGERLWKYGNKYGKLTKYTDEAGNVTEYIYDSLGNCTEKKINGNTVEKREYYDNGLLKKTDLRCGKNSYEYDSNYCLTSDRQFLYTYDSRGNLVSKTDRNQNVYKYSYSEDGKSFTVINPYALETTYVMNNRKDIVKIIRRDLRESFYDVTEYVYDKCHNIKEVYSSSGKTLEQAENNAVLMTSAYYTNAGRISKVISWNYGKARENDSAGICTEYVYDFKGSSVEKKKYFVDGSGEKTGREYSVKTVSSFEDDVKKINVSMGNSYVQYVYGDSDRLKSINYSGGKTEKYIYDKAGRISSIKNVFGGKKYFKYSADGLINSVIYEDGSEETYKYDSYGRIKLVSGTKSGTVEYSYADISSGNTVSVKKANGQENYEYDLSGNLVKYSAKDGGNKSVLENSVSYKNDYRLHDVVNAGVAYENRYDCFGRCVYSDSSKCYYEYDLRGNVCTVKKLAGKKESVTEIQYNALDEISYVKTPSGNEINYFYDAAGNLLKQTDSEGIIWEGTYSENGLLASEKGRLLPLKEYTYNSAGNLTKVTEAGEDVCKYRYIDDEKNQEHKIEYMDALGNIYSEYYDMRGRISRIVNREGKRKDISYDGNVKTITDFNRNKTVVTENVSLGQIDVKYSDGTSDVLNYNILNQITDIKSACSTEKYIYENSRLKTQIIDGNEYSYTYDALGRKRTVLGNGLSEYFTYNKDGSVKQSVCNDVSLSYEYDVEGREICSYASDGSLINTQYDVAGRVVSIEQKDRNGKLCFAEYYFYDEDGRICAVTDHEGSLTLYEYDKHGRISKAVLPYTKEIENKFIEEYSESGDAVGKTVVYKTAAVPKEYLVKLKKVWSKNNLRLPKAQNGQLVWTECYEYDANGNRIKKETPAGTIHYYYDKENRLVKYGDINFVYIKYDKNGNMLLKDSVYKNTELKYNLNNRVTQIVNLDKKNNVSETYNYGYDALSRCITKSRNGRQTMRTVYDGFSLNPLTEFRTGGKSSKVTVEGYKASTETYFPEQRSFLYKGGMLRGQSSQSDSYIFCNDIRGSIRSVGSLKKTKSDLINYDAGGTPFISSGTKSAEVSAEIDSFGLDHLYCGKSYEASVGLYDFGYRNYSSSYGVFSSCDPILDGYNWYSYCAGDPINFIDPDGLFLMNTTFKFLMQEAEWTDQLVGNATQAEYNDKGLVDNDMNSIGCAITVMADIISSAILKKVTPGDINSMKEYFSTEEGKESDLMMKKLGEDYGLQFDYWTKEKTNLANKILEIEGSKDPLFIAAQVKYSLDNHTHWVNVIGTEEIDGKFYLLIEGTSERDNKNGRPREGWIEKDGKLLVIIDDVTQIYTYDAENAHDLDRCSK